MWGKESNSNMKKYRTNLIDEATYHVIRGLKYSGKRTGVRSSTFSFDETKELEISRKRFYSGNIQVNLHRWLSIRQQIKNDVNNMIVHTKSIGQGLGTVKNGDTYFYLSDGRVMQAFFGKTSSNLHHLRIRNGNFYLTREDAEEALKTPI